MKQAHFFEEAFEEIEFTSSRSRTVSVGRDTGGSGFAGRGFRMVRTQTEAKRFFVDKVPAQAGYEGMALSDAEQKMLFWSESDPDWVVDLELPERLAAEISDEDYEKKIAGLLSRAYRAEIARSQEARDQWKQASDVLHQGDHYILIMLDQDLAGLQTKRWWKFW